MTMEPIWKVEWGKVKEALNKMGQLTDITYTAYGREHPLLVTSL